MRCPKEEEVDLPDKLKKFSKDLKDPQNIHSLNKSIIEFSKKLSYEFLDILFEYKVLILFLSNLKREILSLSDQNFQIFCHTRS